MVLVLVTTTFSAQTCQKGSYYDSILEECQMCSPGTFSVGGGVKITYWDPAGDWQNIEGLLIRNYCSQAFSSTPINPSCIGWEGKQNWVQTASTAGISNIDFVLEFQVAVVQDIGSLSFNYMSITERPQDGLWWQIDNLQASKLENSADFVPISLSLDKGIHIIRLMFYKNPTVSSGIDVARIQIMQISGIKPYDTRCFPCAPGTYASFSAAFGCLPCSSGLVTLSEGSTSCIKCPEGTFARNGTTCEPISRDCSEEDMISFVKSGCDGSFSEVLSYGWQSPQMCNPADFELLPDQMIPCSPCPAGFQTVVNSTRRMCLPCNTGTFYDHDYDRCQPCPKGTSATTEMIYNEWSQIPFGFTSGCQGDCVISNGWTLYHDHISTYNAIASLGRVWLDFEAVMLAKGSISFSFYFQQPTSNRLTFIVDNIGVEVLDGSITHLQNKTFSLSAGSHVIRWEFVVSDPNSASDFSISTIHVVGSSQGSAPACIDCPAGSYQSLEEQATCLLCSSGENSLEKSVACTECYPSSYAPSEGSPTCLLCKSGMTSTIGAEYCTPDGCGFTYSWTNLTFSYNLSPYQNYYSYIVDPSLSDTYVLSFCDRLVDGPCAHQGFVCQQFSKFDPFDPSSKASVFGRQMAFHALPIDEILHQPAGFQLLFTDGDSDGCPPGKNRSATVTFFCNLNDTQSLHLVKSEDCYAEFSLTSSFGCPMCTYEDFAEVASPCLNGVQNVSYVKIPGRLCNGYISMLPKSCDTGKDNSGYIIMGVVFGVGTLVLTVLLIAAIAFLAAKHRKLKFKYEQLQRVKVVDGSLPESE